jgi:2-polyprenyl-3-methyl-5-hydroxy-6-metoxy-1,4-benzoquinol methylase
MGSSRWDAIFASREFRFNREPNGFLAEVAKTLTPGKALEIGAGQGRNAIYLAQQGWDVTGVDSSAEGIGQARQRADELHVALQWVQQPIEAFDMGQERWDLIAGIYVHGVVLRQSERIFQALKPGGVLVVEGFHRDVMNLGVETVDGGLLGYKTNALLRHFLALRIEKYEDRPTFGDWQNRETPIVRLLARKE